MTGHRMKVAHSLFVRSSVAVVVVSLRDPDFPRDAKRMTSTSERSSSSSRKEEMMSGVATQIMLVSMTRSDKGWLSRAEQKILAFSPCKAK